ncbi:MAG: endonuclease/exonuclease/phosphatase family protein [Sphingomonadales bacterium]|nr:endonuclease/exonuclease/phosphatase family protein [Sphingomonadales bacterium]MBL0000100.1 endonuclease/exonuclease/phosphatase family protein [Sphingomonadales bacterium]MBL0116045.1 endonuclease/exonuclease/phosphatase family protein [Sphingomonadales bacterium]
MIRVASYNIRKAIGTDRLRRPERILSVIDEVGADIIALQEADRRFGARKSALPLELLDNHGELRPVHFGNGQEGIGWHGNAMLVRSHIKVMECRPLIIPSLEPRGAVLVECRVGKQDLRIVGMHLDLSGLWRKRQVRAILDAVLQRPEKMPTILMGDLNEWARHRGCLVEFLHDYRIVFTGPSFHSQRPVARLDRIMVGEELRILRSGTHNTAQAKRASDHLPVWAELAF